MRFLTVMMFMMLVGCASTDDYAAENIEPSYTIDDLNYKAIDYHTKRIAYQLAEQIHVSHIAEVEVEHFTLPAELPVQFQRGFRVALKRALRKQGFGLKHYPSSMNVEPASENVMLTPSPAIYRIAGDIALTAAEVIVNTQVIAFDSNNVYATHSQVIPFKPQQRRELIFQSHRSYVRGPLGSDEEI